MSQTHSSIDIVPTVGSVCKPRLGYIIEDYGKSAHGHDDSPNLSHLAKRSQAFARFQQFHNEVRPQTEAEAIKHLNLSGVEHNNFASGRNFGAVVQNQGDLDLEEAYTSGSRQTNPMDLSSILNPQPAPLPKQGRDWRSPCTYPGCDWKTKDCYGRTLRQHIETKHKKILYPCGAGCSKSFTTQRYRREHEISQHNYHSTKERNRLDRQHSLGTTASKRGELDSNRFNAETDGEDRPALETAPGNTAEGSRGRSASDDASCFCPYPDCNWQAKVGRKMKERCLTRHMKAWHTMVRYACEAPGCQQSFVSNNGRKVHELKQHGIVAPKYTVIRHPLRYPCEVRGCGQVFTSRSNRERHQVNVHATAVLQ